MLRIKGIKGEYLFKYPRVYPIKDLLKIKKKQINRLYKITNKYCRKWNKNSDDRTQTYLHMFLILLNRNYSGIKFRNKIKNLKADYKELKNDYDREKFLQTHYGMRCKYLALSIIKKYK